MSDTSNNAYTASISAVQAQVEAMNQRADASLATAQGLIDQLSSADNLPSPPNAPEYNDDPKTASIPAFKGRDPNPSLFGDIAGMDKFEPDSFEDIAGDIDFTDIEIPEFEPSVTELDIPKPPEPSATGSAPAAPTLTDVSIPEASNIEIPDVPTLRDLDIPEFEFPELPTFDDQAPEFDAEAPDSAVEYEEPEYKSENLEQAKSAITALMQGGTGIPAEVEEAIFARTVERADREASAEIQAAFEGYAARGWSMPPGMVERTVRSARESRQEKVAEARRDIMVQASRFEIENLQFAVQQGLALEQVLSNIFDNTQQRALRLAELRQQADISLFNAQVSLFNARQQAYQVGAQVFEKRLNAALSQLDVYRTRIEGQKAIGELNRQRVDAFTAQIQAVREKVGIYTARMQGAEIQTRMQGNEIDRYRAEVDAYGKRIDADKSRFDAYEAQVRGEAAKADIVSAQARAFASTIQGVQAKSSIRTEQIRARISAVGAATDRFQAKVAAERDFVSSQAAALRARADAYSADVRRYSAEVDSDRSRNELEARVNQDRVRNALAFYETQLRNYDSILQRINQQANIKIQGVTAAGQMASQLAAGAMSAVNIGASISGSGSESVSQTYYHDMSS